MAILGKTTMTEGECYGDLHIDNYLYVNNIKGDGSVNISAPSQYYVNFECNGSNVTYNGKSYKGGLINCLPKAVGSATITAYSWTPNNNFGASEYQHIMNHTAATLNVSISHSYFTDNCHYLLIHQKYNAPTCTVVIGANNEIICTKDGVTTFTLEPAQSLELCGFSPDTSDNITYITYTILYD